VRSGASGSRPPSMPSRALRSTLLRAGLALLAVPLLLGVLEAALWLAAFEYRSEPPPIVVWNPHEDREMQAGRGLFVRDPDQLWVPRPGATIPWCPPEEVNAAGFRGPLIERERTPGRLRVATLGDSSTFGLPVAGGETWSAQLEAELRARGQAAEVMNGGVVGFTVLQGIERYRALIRLYRPDVVVAAFGAVNEHNPAIGGLDDLEKISRSRGLPGRPGSLLAWMRDESRVSQLVTCLQHRRKGGRAALKQREERALHREHERAKGAGKANWSGTRRMTPADFERALAALAEEVRADGARLILVNMPRMPVAEERLPVLPLYSERVELAARREDLAMLDARALFRAETAQGRPAEELFAGDWWHPSPLGHGLLARGLAPLVLDASLRRSGDS
jgi:lysophospholipase L1-like esterase